MISQKGLAPMLIVILMATLFGGYLIYSGKIDIKQQITPQNQTPIPTSAIPTTPQAVIDQKPNWQTYSDTKAGFSVQYPPNHKVNEKLEREKVTFLNCGSDFCSDGMAITIYNDYDGGSRRVWLSKKFDLSTYNPYYEDLYVAGVNALFVATRDPASNNTVFVVIPKGNKVYLYTAQGDAIPPSQTPNLNKHQEILSTFKFTEKSSLNPAPVATNSPIPEQNSSPSKTNPSASSTNLSAELKCTTKGQHSSDNHVDLVFSTKAFVPTGKIIWISLTDQKANTSLFITKYDKLSGNINQSHTFHKDVNSVRGAGTINLKGDGRKYTLKAYLAEDNGTQPEYNSSDIDQVTVNIKCSF